MLPDYSQKIWRKQSSFIHWESANAYFGNARETSKKIDAFVQKDYWELKTKYREVILLRQLTVYNRQKELKRFGISQTKSFEIIAFEIKEGKEKIHDCST